MSDRIDLVCMGEPMLEYNQLPPGPDGRRLYVEGCGGDTCNAAVAAARQGARVAYVTALGRDPAGERFIQLWREEGVDASAVLCSADRATAVYFVTHGPAGHEFLYYRRDSAAAGFGPADVPEALISRAKMFFATGISQGISDSAADAVFRAMDIARGHGVRVAYDTNYRPRLWPVARAAAVIHAAVAQADIALPGLEDARVLTGLSDPDAIADFYLRLGPKIVAVKLGDAGALLATPAGRTRLPPFPCKPVDATGAGDVFCGSFLARLIAGDTELDAGRYASVAAALQTQNYGAIPAIPRADDVLAAQAKAC
jgi:2-dehydro-3-deoxygluconokinase